MKFSTLFRKAASAGITPPSVYAKISGIGRYALPTSAYFEQYSDSFGEENLNSLTPDELALWLDLMAEIAESLGE